MKNTTAGILSDWCNLETVEQLYFLKWIHQYHPNMYDYCSIPDNQAVYYNGPLHKELVKSMQNKIKGSDEKKLLNCNCLECLKNG